MFAELLKGVSKISVKSCAAADMGRCWNDIDFKKTKGHIKKLQMRLAKAFQDGAYGKAEFLQHKLIHSFEAKALAVKVVTSNTGKHTPGVDGVLWTTPEDKWNAIFDLGRRGYKPSPLRRIYIPKSNGEKRPLSIPTIKDRAMQTLYKFALEPIAEITADLHSYGFRSGKCAQDAIKRCVEVLSKYPENTWVLEADIKSCFDSISHDWVMEHIPMDKLTLRKFLTSGFIEQEEWNPTEQGIPQGGPISAVICNMVLDGLEKELETTCCSKVHLIRYADDFIVIGASRELLERSAMPSIRSFLVKRGLQLSVEKTAITHIEDRFDFLGWNVRRDDGQILVEPSKKNLSSFLGKIRNIIKRNPHTTFEQRLVILTPNLGGWVNYHKGIVTSSSLNRAANDILSCLEE